MQWTPWYAVGRYSNTEGFGLSNQTNWDYMNVRGLVMSHGFSISDQLKVFWAALAGTTD